jgi:hypothetical protein
MRPLIFLTIVWAAVWTGCGGGQESPHETVKGNHISVTYGRPYKKDRVIFGELVKYGEVWRTGADEATEITFDKDAQFGGRPIKAGTYTLFTIPNETEWTIILNSELDQFGAFDYEEHKAKNVLEVKAPTKRLDQVVEQFTIRFTPQNNMVMEWDQTQVEVPVGGL